MRNSSSSSSSGNYSTVKMYDMTFNTFIRLFVTTLLFAAFGVGCYGFGKGVISANELIACTASAILGASMVFAITMEDL